MRIIQVAGIDPKKMQISRTFNSGSLDQFCLWPKVFVKQRVHVSSYNNCV